MGGFAHWLRSNSEHYLVEASQREMAQRYLQRPGPAPTDRGLRAAFWRRVFVPAYRLVPWGVRHRITQAMPGSHRQTWQDPPARRPRRVS